MKPPQRTQSTPYVIKLRPFTPWVEVDVFSAQPKKKAKKGKFLKDWE